MKETSQIKIDYADATRLALLEQSIGSISQTLLEIKHENKIRFDRIDAKFDKVDSKFSSIDDKFRNISQQIHELAISQVKANQILSALSWFAGAVVAYIVLPYIKAKFLL